MCTVCALDVNATVNIRNNVCVTGEKLNVSGLAYKIMSSRKYHGPYFDTVRHLGDLLCTNGVGWWSRNFGALVQFALRRRGALRTTQHVHLTLRKGVVVGDCSDEEVNHIPTRRWGTEWYIQVSNVKIKYGFAEIETENH